MYSPDFAEVVHEKNSLQIETQFVTSSPHSYLSENVFQTFAPLKKNSKMSGGIAVGARDAHLVGSPDISFFRSTYKLYKLNQSF